MVEGKYVVMKVSKTREKGEKLGIKEVERVSQKGNPYTILVYPPNIQRMLVEHFVREDNLA